MHLMAWRATTFMAAGARFSVSAGETIHTENSYKYSGAEARLIARAAGWTPAEVWTGPEMLFSLHLWTAEKPSMQP